MYTKYSVIIIPGLGDKTGILKILTNHWKKHGLHLIFHAVGWQDGEDFTPKLNRLLDLVDQLTKNGGRVSIVGTSAGGSAALNAFIKRRSKIHTIINVCGRLRTGPEKGFRSFQTTTAPSQAFAQAVKLAEANEHTLSKADRKRVMTVRARFGDQIVPADTTILEGAFNKSVPTAEHMLSIGAALTLFSKPLITFLIKE